MTAQAGRGAQLHSSASALLARLLSFLHHSRPDNDEMAELLQPSMTLGSHPRFAPVLPVITYRPVSTRKQRGTWTSFKITSTSAPQ